jgi:predicted regulator of Ras-like GTPase activity (Roadblock/LC7/MglB family)
MAERIHDAGSALEEALRPLLEMPGILGGLISATDGLLMAAVVKEGLDQESLAAAGARLGQLAAARLSYDDLDVAVLDATRLRLVVHPTALGYLTVVADPAGQIEPALAAARQVGKVLEETTATMAALEAIPN